MDFQLSDDSVTITEAGQTIALPKGDVLAIADTIRALTPEPELGKLYRHPVTPAKWMTAR